MNTDDGDATTDKRAWNDALIELYEGHFDRLVDQLERKFDDRELAQDAVQDAFLVFHSRGCGPAPGREVAYLATAARNNALQALRTASRRRRILLENNNAALRGPSAETETLRACEARSLADNIASLPDRQGSAFVMRHVKGLTVSETADELGLSTGTVKTHTHRAVHALRRSQDALGDAA